MKMSRPLNLYSRGLPWTERAALVRRNSHHAVTAVVRTPEAAPGIVLVRVEKKQGPVPDVSDIVGPVFHDLGALRNAVKVRMRKINLHTDDGDIHDE
jgi:hypothetical protein